MDQEEIMDVIGMSPRARVRRLRATYVSLSADRQVELLAIAETIAKLPSAGDLEEWRNLAEVKAEVAEQERALLQVVT